MVRYGVKMRPDTSNYFIRMTSAEASKIITRIEPIEKVKQMVSDKTFKEFVEGLVEANKARFGGTDWKVSVKTAARTEELFDLEGDSDA